MRFYGVHAYLLSDIDYAVSGLSCCYRLLRKENQMLYGELIHYEVYLRNYTLFF